MRLFKLLGIMLVTLSILACSSKVTQQNFDRINNNMTFEQVTKILGKPTTQRHIEIGSLSATAAKWEAKGKVITIQFLDNKVTFKSFSAMGVNKLEIQ